jgi:hypothetical protein
MKKVIRSMRMIGILIILLAASSIFANEGMVSGKSLETRNFFCENINLLKMQKLNAQSALEKHLQMREGICAWTQPDAIFRMSPQSKKIIIHDLENQGCEVEITVEYSC